MDSYIKATNTKRFVVEDSITRVTSDGEPHEMMTMIAGLSGLLAAIVILAILVSLVGCKKNIRTQHSTESIKKLPSSGQSDDDATNSKRSSLATIYTRGTSVAEDNPRSLLTSVSVISNGNLEGNLNSAFAGSEFSLSNSMQKHKKRTHWRDEVEDGAAAKETTIDIERY